MKKYCFIAVMLIATQSHGISAPKINEEGNNLKAATQRVRKNLAGLPLVFIENKGQWDDNTQLPQGRILFSTQVSSTQAFFAEQGIYYSLIKIKMAEEEPQKEIGQTEMIEDEVSSVDVLHYCVRFLGAQSTVSVHGVDKGITKVNYFYGNDPQKYYTNVANYGGIEYENLYDKIDVMYYGTNEKLKYDCHVRSGGRVEDIRMLYEGVEDVKVTEGGQLEIMTKWGIVIEDAPYSYQMVDGERKEVGMRYTCKEVGDQTMSLDRQTSSPERKWEVGFAVVGSYDKAEELIIDPYTLLWSTFVSGFQMGAGIGQNYINSIDVDDSGNTYATGVYFDNAFPVTNGSYDTTYGGAFDAYVFKLDPSGKHLIYATYLGGAGADRGLAIAVNKNGEAFVTGETNSLDFPTTSGAFQSIRRGPDDAFITKLSSGGDRLLYSTLLGGSGGNDRVKVDIGYDIVVNNRDEAFITGVTTAINFPVTPGAFQVVNNGGADAFVTKISADGKSLIYSTYLGGQRNENVSLSGAGIAINDQGEAYVTGTTMSEDFPVTSTAIKGSQNYYNGDYFDAFVTRLNADGSGLVYSTHLGGSSYDFGTDIALGKNGEIYVTGSTISTDFPVTPGAYQSAIKHKVGASYCFVTKLSADGRSIDHSTYLSGSTFGKSDSYVDFFNGPSSIAINQAGEVYVGGFTTATDFPVTLDAYQKENGSDTASSSFYFNDLFLSKLSPDLSHLLYSTYMGGDNNDYYKPSIRVSPAGDITFGATSHSADFPTTAGTFRPIKAGNEKHDEDVVFRFSSSPCFSPQASVLGKKPGDAITIPIFPSMKLDDAKSIDLVVKYDENLFRLLGNPTTTLSGATISSPVRSRDQVSFTVTITDSVPSPTAEIAELHAQVLLAPYSTGSIEVTTSTVRFSLGAHTAGRNCPLIFSLDSTCVHPSELEPRSTAAIEGIYPNPSYIQTTVVIIAENNPRMRLEVYDAFGRQVKVLQDDELTNGKHEITMNTKHYSSGIYFCRLIYNGQITTKAFNVQR